MLNRRHRLLTSDDFRAVFRRGKKSPIKGGLVAVRVTGSDRDLRCGFVVSKAVGNAVARNTVKRRLRAACVSVVEDFSGADIVVRADKSALSVTVNEWRKNLGRVLEKAGLS